MIAHTSAAWQQISGECRLRCTKPFRTDGHCIQMRRQMPSMDLDKGLIYLEGRCSQQAIQSCIEVPSDCLESHLAFLLGLSLLGSHVSCQPAVPAKATVDFQLQPKRMPLNLPGRQSPQHCKDTAWKISDKALLGLRSLLWNSWAACGSSRALARHIVLPATADTIMPACPATA